MNKEVKEDLRRADLLRRLSNLLLNSTDDFSQDDRDELLTDIQSVPKLRDKIETLERVKVEVGIKDHVVVPTEYKQALEERLYTLEKYKKHYDTKASAGATLRLAVEDLLTYGIWFSDYPEAQEEAEKINKYLRTVIETRNYIIQKQPLGQYKSEDGFSTEEIEGQGLIVNKRPRPSIDSGNGETHFV